MWADDALWVANGWSVWRIYPGKVRKLPVDGRVLAFGAETPTHLTRPQAVWVLLRKRA
jgi:hypothetical protein